MNIKDHWVIVYAIMKSLKLDKLEIEDKYYNITPDDIFGMYITKDIKSNKTIVTIKNNIVKQYFEDINREEI